MVMPGPREVPIMCRALDMHQLSPDPHSNLPCGRTVRHSAGESSKAQKVRYALRPVVAGGSWGVSQLR